MEEPLVELCSEEAGVLEPQPAFTYREYSLTVNIHFSPPDHPAQGSKRWLEFGVR